MLLVQDHFSTTMFQKKSFLLAVVALMVIPNAFAFEIEPRIVKGTNAERGQFPYYTYLEIQSKDGGSVCGGSIISNSHILTAAHCIEGATSVQVHLGSLRAEDYREPGRKIIDVTKTKDLIMHPMYFELAFFNDIGLIKLPSPVEFTDIIQPVPLACSSAKEADVLAIGNGHTGSDKKFSKILQYTELKTLGTVNCLRQFLFLIFRNSVMCVNGDKQSLRSICQGDSGGPIVTANGKLVGLSSFTSGEAGCENGDPQGITSVSAHLDWIKKVTGVACTK